MKDAQVSELTAERVQMSSLRPFLTDIVLEAREQGAVIVTRNGKDFFAIVSLAVAVAGIKALAEQAQ